MGKWRRSQRLRATTPGSPDPSQPGGDAAPPSGDTSKEAGTEAPKQETSQAKAELLRLASVQCDGSMLNEALVKVERENPTLDDPTSSPNFPGRWRYAFLGSTLPKGPIPSPSRPLALVLYVQSFTLPL